MMSRVRSAPNLLTLTRLLVVPLLLVVAAMGNASMFLVLLGYALLTDVIDGRLARARHQESVLGAKLDSIADCALYLTVPAAVLVLFPALRPRLVGPVVATYSGYAIPICYGMLKYRRLTCYHTIGARIAGVLVSIALFLVIATGVVWPLDVAIVVLLVSAFEEMAITHMLPDWRANVPSVWHAMQWRTRKVASPDDRRAFGLT